MKSLASYPLALIYGAYLYLIFQVLYYVRFESVNLTFSTIDLFIYVVGVVSVVMLLFLGKRLGGRGVYMLFPFVLAVPFGYVGTLGGGLFGIAGMLVGGLAPFAIILPIGYFLLGRGRKSEKKQLGAEPSQITPREPSV